MKNTELKILILEEINKKLNQTPSKDNINNIF